MKVTKVKGRMGVMKTVERLRVRVFVVMPTLEQRKMCGPKHIRSREGINSTCSERDVTWAKTCLEVSL